MLKLIQHDKLGKTFTSLCNRHPEPPFFRHPELVSGSCAWLPCPKANNRMLKLIQHDKLGTTPVTNVCHPELRDPVILNLFQDLILWAACLKGKRPDAEINSA